jgi:hypothetical protein
MFVGLLQHEAAPAIAAMSSVLKRGTEERHQTLKCFGQAVITCAAHSRAGTDADCRRASVRNGGDKRGTAAAQA